MKHMAAILASAAVLAGCSGQGRNETVQANAAGAAGSSAPAPEIIDMQPGQWEVTAEIRRMEAPGLPGNTIPPTPPTTTSHCITPDLASKPLDGILAGGAMPGDCVSESNEVANGRIRATFSCAQNGIPSRTTISGAFSPTNYDMTMDIHAGEGDAAIRSEILVRGRRIGECRTPAGQ